MSELHQRLARRPAAQLATTADAVKDQSASAIALDKRQALLRDSSHNQRLKQLHAGMTSTASNAPVQRRITVYEETWDAAEFEAFQEIYGHHQQGILSAIREEIRPNPPGTVLAALADPRDIGLFHHGKGNYTARQLDKIEETEDGIKMTAWGFPVALNRPREGKAAMHITGLSDCLGIFAVQWDEAGAANRIAALHFVSSECLTKGELNDTGLVKLIQLVNLVLDGGRATVFIVRSTSQNTGFPGKASSLAKRKVAALMPDLGISDVRCKAPYGAVTFYLDSKGRASYG